MHQETICLENKKNIEEQKITDSAPVYGLGLPLYVLLPLCALASTLICTGGWRSGLRATLLGGSLLLGVFLIKKFCPLDADWKKRVLYFTFAGILAGLLAASLVWALELAIGSPTLNNNPYNQNTKNLFLVCSLYGFFMLGCFALAFKLSRLARYFIVLGGAALANTFGLADIAYNPDLGTYILGILRNCAIYYIPCLGNCILFVLLWNACADRVFNMPLRRLSFLTWIISAIIGVILGYFGFIIIGAMSLSITPERYFVKYKETVFKEKFDGVIIVLRNMKYYDCQKKVFYDLPENITKEHDFTPNNKKLKIVKLRNSNYIEILKDGKVEKKISLHGTWKCCIVNDSVYYTRNRKLFRLKAPDYDKPELLLEKFKSYRFCISPDEKFIAYYEIANVFEFRILCVMNLKSKKILALKKAGHASGDIYWINNIDELRMFEIDKKKKTKK